MFFIFSLSQSSCEKTQPKNLYPCLSVPVDARVKHIHRVHHTKRPVCRPVCQQHVPVFGVAWDRDVNLRMVAVLDVSVTPSVRERKGNWALSVVSVWKKDFLYFLYTVGSGKRLLRGRRGHFFTACLEV